MSLEIVNKVHAIGNIITYANADPPLLSPKGTGFASVLRVSPGLFRVTLSEPLPPWNDVSGLEAPNCAVVASLTGSWKTISANLVGSSGGALNGTTIEVRTFDDAAAGALEDFNEIIPIVVTRFAQIT
ncbi:MAG TPA: hypothetical protein VJN18_11220 [Polyangiaceae bacterium]|nr:hypothetical protein [Polyangiaceae bacterium]